MVLECGIENVSSFMSQEQDKMHFIAIGIDTNDQYVIRIPPKLHVKWCIIVRVRQENGVVLDGVIHVELTSMANVAYATFLEVLVYKGRARVLWLIKMHIPLACSKHDHWEENWWY